MRLNPHLRRPARRKPGFLLLEVLLALGVFGMAATGFAVALHRTADLAATAQRKVKITRLLESSLAEAMSYPVLEEGTDDGKSIEEMSEADLKIYTTVELLPEIENEDGQLLQEMYRIQVTATWYDNNERMVQSAETCRYSRLYPA